MPIKKLLLLTLAAFGICAVSVPASAARACYTPSELQAEQLLRLHSELMVIAITCRQGSYGQDLISYYTGFTRNNIGILRDAEQTLIRYYDVQSSGDGIPGLDRLRTKLGNEYGQKIADVSAPAYCRQKRDLVVSLYRETPPQLANEIHNMVMTEPSYGLPCATTATATAAAVPALTPAPLHVPTLTNLVIASNANYVAHPAVVSAGLGVGTSMDYVSPAAADLVGNNSANTNTNMRLAPPPGAMDK